MQDPNGEELLEGVEVFGPENLKKQGHRWTSCPDYQAAAVFSGQSMSSALSGRNTQVPVVAAVCRCGAIVTVPLGVG